MKQKIIIKQNEAISFPDNKTKLLVEKAIKKVEDFFESKLDFEIIFLETRKEMDKIYSEMFGEEYKTEDWVVGGVFNEAVVYLFDEEVYDKVSCHPQETFFPTLIHEITHIFTKDLFNINIMWLNEGISYLVAEQDKVPLNKKEDLTKAYTEKEWMQTNPYLTAGKFTRYLFNRYGKEKMFKLLIKLSSKETKKEFEETFFEIISEDFNLIWNSWFNKEE
jgi:hypothetical protein